MEALVAHYSTMTGNYLDLYIQQMHRWLTLYRFHDFAKQSSTAQRRLLMCLKICLSIWEQICIRLSLCANGGTIYPCIVGWVSCWGIPEKLGRNFSKSLRKWLTIEILCGTLAFVRHLSERGKLLKRHINHVQKGSLSNGIQIGAVSSRGSRSVRCQ